MANSDASIKNAKFLYFSTDASFNEVKSIIDSSNPHSISFLEESNTIYANSHKFSSPIEYGEGTNSAIQKNSYSSATGTNSFAKSGVSSFIYHEGEYDERTISASNKTIASGLASSAEGIATKASGQGAHAEGHMAITNDNFDVTSITYNGGSYPYDQKYEESMHPYCWENDDLAPNIIYTDTGYPKIGDSVYAGRDDDEKLGTVTDRETVEIQTTIFTEASGRGAHAEGLGTKAENSGAHSEGIGSIADGGSSHAEGLGTVTNNTGEHAEGRFNASHSGSASSGNTQHSVGIGTSTADRKNAFEIMQNGDIYLYGVGGYTGTNPNTSGVSKLQDLLNKCVSITWSALKALRDASTLIPGQQYRITDYTCTTSQSTTTSAGHLFDIIVVVDDESHLNEVARACHHSGDTYFASCDLEAWELKYCLDNDTTRFNWASSSGKGVIYYMKDEFNNECPYDFKNIQFYRKWNSTTSSWSDTGTSSDGVATYTFSSAGTSSTTSFTDLSLSGLSNNIYSNVIKEYIISNKQTLNNNCFFGNGSCYNTFGNYCRCNTFGSSCYSNTFGNYCGYNTFGNDCYSNTFGNYCRYNTFGNYCGYNTFGNYYYSNTFGTSCYSNTFGNDCYSNTFGTGCYSNTFGNNCCSNTFGDLCTFNRLFDGIGDGIDDGEYATGLILNDYAKYNIIESGIKNVELSGDDIQNYYIKSSANHNGINWCQEILDEEYTNFTIHSINASQIVVTFTDDYGEGETHSNVTFAFSENNHGLYSWTNSSYNTIYTNSNSSTSCNIGDWGDVYVEGYQKLTIVCIPDLEYCMTVARKSNGNIVQYCEADLIADQN